MILKGVTLKGIQVFETLAQTGSVARTASALGLSQPAVSQQMRNLEEALGTDLIDHSRRPMGLTPAGRLFQRHTAPALSALRRAQSEVIVLDLDRVDALNVGMIGDFDDHVAPRFTSILADSLGGSKLRFVTDDSKTLVRKVADAELDMALVAQPDTIPENVAAYPIVRDPFILLAPAGSQINCDLFLAGESDLPFLAYASDRLICSQVQAFLAHSGADITPTFQIDSHAALMGMVERGGGWTITTPLGYMRAAKYHNGIQAVPLQNPNASRDIALCIDVRISEYMASLISTTIRRLVKIHVIRPSTTRLPWLSDRFVLQGEAA